MQSPFKFFRRHQKAFLAFLALGAMIAFGVGDVITKMTGPSYRQNAETVVSTSAGKLNERDMLRLRSNRRLANEFIFRAFQATLPNLKNARIGAPRAFGSDAPQEVLYAWILRQEADRLGIRVDDEHISQFLDQTFGRNLSTTGFNDALKALRVSQYDMYAILRDELLAQIAFKVLNPRVAASPEQYWTYYQMLHTRQKIEVAALPIADFLALVEEPQDSEVREFFEQHKEKPANSHEGEFVAGFFQPRRVKLQYVALDYDKAEEQALAEKPITDEEIEAYYEEKKHLDLRFQERDARVDADDKPLEPQFAPEEPASDDGRKLSPPGHSGDEASESGTSIKNPAPEKPQPPGEEDADPDQAPADPRCDADQRPEASADPSDALTQAEDQPAENAGESGGKNAASAKPAAASAAETDGPNEAESQGDEATAAEKPRVGNDEADGEDEEMSGEEGKPAGAKPQKPGIRFKPLNDEVKEMIRESLVQQRASERLKVLSAEVSKAMYDAGLKLGQKLPEPKPKATPTEIDHDHAALEPAAAEELKAIAERMGLKYGETSLVSASDLLEDPVLGKSREAQAVESFFETPSSILELVFRDQNLYGSLELEDRSGFDLDGGGSGARFVAWKVRDVAEHVPTLDEPGVREQVVKAWKHLKALPLARKRADEIVELLKNAQEGSEQALAGQTITGGKESSALALAESPEFSWFRELFAPMVSQGASPVELGNPIVVNKPGSKFMEYVFQMLKEGDVGAVMNDDASVCYVVKVVSRRPAQREAFKSAPLFGVTSPYAALAEIDAQRVLRAFQEELFSRYAVKWHSTRGNQAPTPDLD
jgi:hypothetical protein